MLVRGRIPRASWTFQFVRVSGAIFSARKLRSRRGLQGFIINRGWLRMYASAKDSSHVLIQANVCCGSQHRQSGTFLSSECTFDVGFLLPQANLMVGGGGFFFVEILSSQITLACIKLKANKPAQPWTSGLFEAGIREECRRLGSSLEVCMLFSKRRDCA